MQKLIYPNRTPYYITKNVFDGLQVILFQVKIDNRFFFTPQSQNILNLFLFLLPSSALLFTKFAFKYKKVYYQIVA